MEQRDSCRQGSECRGLQIQGPEDSETSDFSGIARRVHVGSFAPNSCTCAPILAYACVCLPIACQNMHVSLYHHSQPSNITCIITLHTYTWNSTWAIIIAKIILIVLHVYYYIHFH